MSATISHVDSLGASIEALEERISRLEQERTAANTANDRELRESVRGLRELFEYAVLRPVDLVKLEGLPYFFYTKEDRKSVV